MSINDIDFNGISTKIECVKIALTQDKNGFVLKLALSPADAPEDVLRDPVGQRYLAVLVRLNDNDEPVAAETDREGIQAVKIAGTLCSDNNFQLWLAQKNYVDDMSEDAASAWMRIYLGLKSRAELKINATARRKLMDLRAEFVSDIKRGVLLK